MAKTVRAAVMQRPGEISVKEFPTPEIKESCALVRMVMSGICGTDIHMFWGETTHPGGQESTFPLIPGHENLSYIEKLGKRNDPWRDANGELLKEGDRVVPACDVNCGECLDMALQYLARILLIFSVDGQKRCTFCRKSICSRFRRIFQTMLQYLQSRWP